MFSPRPAWICRISAIATLFVLEYVKHVLRSQNFALIKNPTNHVTKRVRQQDLGHTAINLASFIRDNKRWLAGGFLLTFLSSFGQTYFIALSGGDIRADFGLSHGEFGSLYMGATLASALTLPFFGRIVDYLSVSRTCAIVFSGLALCCLGMMLTESLIILFFVLYGLRLCGQGMMIHISMTAMGRWYEEQRGRAISLSATGLQAGEACLPIIFVTLFVTFGWRTGWLVAAIVLMAMLPVVYALMHKERIPRGTRSTVDETVRRQWTRKEALRDVYFWFIMIAALTPSFIGTTIFFHQIHITELKGWSQDLFASSFSVLAFSTVVFGLISGWLIDRLSAVILLPIFLLPMGLACFVVASFDHYAAIIVFMALFGISYGSSSTILGTLWPEVYGTRHLGAIRSVVIALLVLSSAVGPGLSGVLIDIGIPLSRQLFVMGIYCLITFILMIIVSAGLTQRAKTYGSAKLANER